MYRAKQYPIQRHLRIWHAIISERVYVWIDYYNNDRYQWALAKLSPREYYRFVTTGIYPLNTFGGSVPPELSILYHGFTPRISNMFILSEYRGTFHHFAGLGQHYREHSSR